MNVKYLWLIMKDVQGKKQESTCMCVGVGEKNRVLFVVYFK